MTKKELSQLYYLNREIEMLKRQLDALESKQDEHTCSTVRASQLSYPYTLHSITVSGATDPEASYRRRAEIRETKALISLKIEQCDIEYSRLMRYINGVEDSLIRQILTYRYVSGFNWTQVAMHIGGGNTADSVKKACYRFLDK